jgi:hypothetical protein
MKENGYRGNFSPPPEDAPRVVVFGDSISSVVGYNTDSSADLSYGDSVADVLGNALGVQATSTAVGGGRLPATLSTEHQFPTTGSS